MPRKAQGQPRPFSIPDRVRTILYRASWGAALDLIYAQGPVQPTTGPGTRSKSPSSRYTTRRVHGEISVPFLLQTACTGVPAPVKKTKTPVHTHRKTGVGREDRRMTHFGPVWSGLGRPDARVQSLVLRLPKGLFWGVSKVPGHRNWSTGNRHAQVPTPGSRKSQAHGHQGLVKLLGCPE